MGLLDSFTKTIMPKNDDTKDAWNRVGYARMGNSHFEDALFAFDSALEIDPKSFDGLLGRAFSIHKLGKINDAIFAYEKWLESISIPSSEINVRDNLPFFEELCELYMLWDQLQTARMIGNDKKINDYTTKIDITRKNLLMGSQGSIIKKISLANNGTKNLVQDEEEKQFCTQCGARFYHDSRFCDNCGKEL